MWLYDTVVGTELEDNAFRRIVYIQKHKGEYVSKAVSEHIETGEVIFRGSVKHADLAAHRSKANDWVNYKEQFFF